MASPASSPGLRPSGQGWSPPCGCWGSGTEPPVCEEKAAAAQRLDPCLGHVTPLPPAPTPPHPRGWDDAKCLCHFPGEGGLANFSSCPGARASAGPPRTHPGHWLHHAGAPGLRTRVAQGRGPGQLGARGRGGSGLGAGQLRAEDPGGSGLRTRVAQGMSPPFPPPGLLCALLAGAPGPETWRLPSPRALC